MHRTHQPNICMHPQDTTARIWKPSVLCRRNSKNCGMLVIEESFFDLKSKEWIVQEKNKYSMENNASRRIQIRFPRGGTVSFYPNYLQHDTQQSILNELYNGNRFRQYRIQGEMEPRVHFLVHEDATDNFDQEQPRYKYRTFHMKGVPPGQFPALIKLSERAKLTCDIPESKIGINPIVSAERNQWQQKRWLWCNHCVRDVCTSWKGWT